MLTVSARSHIPYAHLSSAAHMLLRAPAKGLGCDVGEAGPCRPTAEPDAATVARLTGLAGDARFSSPLIATSDGAGVVVDSTQWTVASSPDGLVAAACG